MTGGALADVLPLSPAQEGLLFHALLAAAGPDVYLVQARFRIDGPLDPASLRAAVDALLVRHPNLRACFRQLGGDQPVQLIPRRAPVPWTVVDLPDDTDGAEFERLLAADRSRRFDLARPPLLRAILVRFAQSSAELVLSMHHILIDGWSMPILAAELTALYTGRGGELAPAAPYRDYLSWLRDQDAVMAGKIWQTALSGATPTLLRPAAPGAPQSRPSEVEFALGAERTAALRRRAATAGCTLNTLTQVAWGLVLSRMTGSRDVVFGAVVSGRPAELAGVQSMVGLLINTVPVRLRTRPGEQVDELLHRLQDEQGQLTPYHHVPLVETQRAVGAGELFDTVLAFESFPQPDGAADPGGLQLVEVRDATHYPLTVTVLAGQRLWLRLSHRPDCVGQAEAELIVARLVRALEQLADGGPVERIDVLPATERQQVLPAPDREAERWAGSVIPQRFAAQVAATPQAVAVRAGGRVLSYAQLAEWADELAHQLLDAGVGPETPVAVLLERSVPLVVAQLAVLQAGGHYVPLDDRQPAARLTRLLGDCAAKHLLAQHTPDWLPPGVRCLGVPDRTVDAAAPPRTTVLAAANARTGPAPDSAAYVMYTSGSTGAPKGVVATHRNVLALASDHRFSAEAHRRVLLHSPHTFDAATYELWVPLLNGGTVVIAPPGPLEPRALAALLTEHRVSALWLTAELFRTVVDLVPDALAGVAEVWAGGDVLSPEAVGQAQRCCPDLRVVNGYGPTETTTFATCHPVVRPAPPAPVPIGRPLDDARTYLLDARLRPVPVGVTGELYVGGAGVTRGYLGQPAGTAERFVADPYAPDPGGRMYRTGDLARWNTGGELEFLGRADSQVKIRGHRIDPAEIEAVLESCPAVRRAVVVVRPDPAGGRRLTGLVMVRSGSGLDQVRQHAADQLPRHLLPTAYLAVDHLPLTPHGKVDRAALPDPVPAVGTVVRAVPRSSREQTLCQLFAAVLGVPEVGPEDNFFDSGGHSLLAMRLTASIEARLKIRAPLSALFQAPTPAALAARLDAAIPDLGLAPLLALRAEGDRTPLFCLHPGMGYGWSYSRLLPHLPVDRPLYALQSPALGEDGELPVSIEQLAEEYLCRITAVQPAGPYLLLGRSFGGLLGYQLAARLRTAGEQVGMLAVLDAVPAAATGGATALDPDLVEQETLHVLRRNGAAPVPASAALDRPETFAAVRAADGPFHGWSQRRLARAADLCSRHIQLANSYRPPRFAGAVTLFSAQAAPGDPDTAAKAAAWRRHADRVDVHELDCAHSEVLMPGPIARIAATLDVILREY